jgi:hypothetical protein
MESNSNKAKAYRDFKHLVGQAADNLLSVSPPANSIHVKQPTLNATELELITKFPPSVLFCFHSRLYFEPCLRCKRSRREAKDNLARFQQQVTDFS